MTTPVKSSLSPSHNGSTGRRLSGGLCNGIGDVTPRGKYDTPVASGSHYRPNARAGAGPSGGGGMLLDTPVGRSGNNSGRSSPVSGAESPGYVSSLRPCVQRTL